MFAGVKIKRYAALLIMTGVIIAAFYLLPLAVAASVTDVETQQVFTGDVKSTVSCSGALQSSTQQGIYYNAPLKISRVLVKIGDSVKAGQRIAEVDGQSTLEAYYGSQNKAAVSDAGQNLQNSGVQLAGSISSGDYSALVSEYLNSVNSAASSSGSASDTAQYSPEIPSFISAPISGVVTEINAVEGQFTNAAQPVAVISDLGSIQALVQIDEILVPEVKAGQKAYITGSGFSSKYTGKVTKIYPTASKVVTDSGTRTVINALISIDKPGGDLKPGLSAKAQIVTADASKPVNVPYEAVQEDNASNEYVFVYKNGRVYKTYVITGKEYDNYEQVVSGLTYGETVVVNPPDSLKSGQFVKPGKVLKVS